MADRWFDANTHGQGATSRAQKQLTAPPLELKPRYGGVLHFWVTSRRDESKARTATKKNEKRDRPPCQCLLNLATRIVT